MPIEPDDEQLAEMAAHANGPDDGPVVMLNLNRYRDRAHYEGEPAPGGDAEAGDTGREAYGRYAEVATGVLERVGGRILWYAQAGQTVIGDESDHYDEVIAVWYPSRSAFLALVGAPEILAARADRAAGLERATLICCESGSEPVLSGP